MFRLGDLFNNLKQWYVDNGILDIEESSTGKEKLIWLDEGDKYDPFVKAPRLMRTAIAKLFPNAKFSEKTEHGFFVTGVQSQQFVNPPNFGSFGSGEEEKEEIATVSQAEPNPEPNNFASESNFGSVNHQYSNPEPNEPNNFAAEANKADNHAISAPPEPNEAKTNYSALNKQQQPLKIGDRVDVFMYKSLCEKFHKIRSIPDRGYTVKELALDNGVLMATIKHPQMKASLVVDADWIMHSLEVMA